MIIGASSAFFFAHGSYYTEGIQGLTYNIIGILLLSWANFFDSADGQLARLTGKKSQLGRILDGAASEVWFIPIYLGLVYRFYLYHQREFDFLGIENTTNNTWLAVFLLLGLVLYSGFGCHSFQCGLADYYRQIHLFFLKGKSGSELDNYTQQKELYDSTPKKGNRLWRMLLKSYANYTLVQEKRTPYFQMLMSKIKKKYQGIDNIPQSFKDIFCHHSHPLMKLTNVLTFNSRAIVLYICCLIDLPWVYFFFEISIMNLIYYYMRYQHEMICFNLLDEL